MEAADNPKSTTRDAATLSALRTRNKRLTFFFIFILVSLFLIIAALITYLVLDINSESRADTASLHSPIINSEYMPDSPITQNPNQTLAVDLRTAAEQLQNATSFFESLPDPGPDALRVILKKCTNLLRAGLVQIRYAIEETGDPTTTRSRIAAAERGVNGCLDDLETVELTSAQAKVLEVYQSVRRCAVFAEMMEERRREKNYWSENNDWMDQVFNFQNVFMLVLVGLQLGFIGFLSWIICCRFR